MNRRKAIRNIFFGTGAVVVATSGYEYYRLEKKPDLAELPQYKDLVAELAETLIPATDTPGAKDAKVGDFICKMIIEHADRKVQNRFMHGLHDVESYARSNYGKPFAQCSQGEREKILVHFETSSKTWSGIMGKVQRKIFGTSFITTLKYYTVMGYATSQLGATRGFAYDFIPGSFQAVLPYQQGQRSWATK